MEIKLQEIYDLYGLVEAINDSTYESHSIIVKDSELNTVVLRISKKMEVEVGKIYHFHGKGEVFKDKNYIAVLSLDSLDDDKDMSDDDKRALKDKFFGGIVIDEEAYIKDIEESIDSIENKIIKDITLDIYNKYKNDFIVSPAAVKFHHAYKGGLMYHTHSVLMLGKAYIKLYPHINKDLVYSGIILHDIAKIIEMSDGKFTLEGKLFGHISLGTALVFTSAERLGYSDTEEAKLLAHVILSHHSEPDFGSPRRPQIIEALIVHLCDMSDAKIQPVVEALSRTKPLEFTEPIQTNDKEKFYKHKLSK